MERVRNSDGKEIGWMCREEKKELKKRESLSGRQRVIKEGIDVKNQRETETERERRGKGNRVVLLFDTVSAPPLFSKLTSLTSDALVNTHTHTHTHTGRGREQRGNTLLDSRGCLKRLFPAGLKDSVSS